MLRIVDMIELRLQNDFVRRHRVGGTFGTQGTTSGYPCPVAVSYRWTLT